MKKILLIIITIVATLLIARACERKSAHEFSADKIAAMESNLKTLESYPRVDFPTSITVEGLDIPRLYKSDSEARYLSTSSEVNLFFCADPLREKLNDHFNPRYNVDVSVIRAFKRYTLDITIEDKVPLERDKISAAKRMQRAQEYDEELSAGRKKSKKNITISINN